MPSQKVRELRIWPPGNKALTSSEKLPWDHAFPSLHGVLSLPMHSTCVSEGSECLAWGLLQGWGRRVFYCKLRIYPNGHDGGEKAQDHKVSSQVGLYMFSSVQYLERCKREMLLQSSGYFHIYLRKATDKQGHRFSWPNNNNKIYS